jgi:hypothetical protein
MSVFASFADKTALAVTQAEAKLKSFADALAVHQAQRPDGSDLDALIDWNDKTDPLETRVTLAEEALEFARRAAKEQARVAAKVEQDRAHTAAGKLATVHAKLAVDIAADAEKLAEKLKRLEDLRSSIEAANEVRGDRPMIVDGEFKVRQIPGTTYPARYSEDTVWFDKYGNVVAPQVLESKAYDAKWITNPAAVKQTIAKTLLTGEVRATPTMPTRLADAITLVDLQGKAIWPAPK